MSYQGLIKFDADGTPMIVLDIPPPPRTVRADPHQNKTVWERMMEWLNDDL